MDLTVYYISGIIVAVFLGLIPATIAKNKGHSFGLWWFYGWALFIVAFIHSLCLPYKDSAFQYQSPAKVQKKNSGKYNMKTIIFAVLSSIFFFILASTFFYEYFLRFLRSHDSFYKKVLFINGLMIVTYICFAIAPYIKNKKFILFASGIGIVHQMILLFDFLSRSNERSIDSYIYYISVRILFILTYVSLFILVFILYNKNAANDLRKKFYWYFIPSAINAVLLLVVCGRNLALGEKIIDFNKRYHFSIFSLIFDITSTPLVNHLLLTLSYLFICLWLMSCVSDESGLPDVSANTVTDTQTVNPLQYPSSYTSITPDANSNFHRAEGFEGSVPQSFADNRIPACPMCGTNSPHWSIDKRRGKEFALDPEENAHKYLFRCEQCGCVLRVPVTDVVGVGRSVLLSYQGIAKKMHGKDVKAIYVTIENVGNVQTTQQYREKEMTLEEINALAHKNGV